jgi:hypothetical protein
MVAGLVLALLSASGCSTDRGSSTTVGLIRELDELLACRRVGRGGLIGRGWLIGRLSPTTPTEASPAIWRSARATYAICRSARAFLAFSTSSIEGPSTYGPKSPPLVRATM